MKTSKNYTEWKWPRRLYIKKKEMNISKLNSTFKGSAEHLTIKNEIIQGVTKEAQKDSQSRQAAKNSCSLISRAK